MGFLAVSGDQGERISGQVHVHPPPARRTSAAADVLQRLLVPRSGFGSNGSGKGCKNRPVFGHRGQEDMPSSMGVSYTVCG
jgi:hypothetical protein